MTSQQSQVWKLLWDYYPEALVVVDPTFYIKLVNPAFCRMFRVEPQDAIDQPVNVILDSMDEFQKAWQHNRVIRSQRREYPSYQVCVNQVTFPIEEEGLIAAMMMDISYELEQKHELEQLKRETIQQVNDVVDHQMKVVQEIAGLLGETTAETKVNLLKIIGVLEHISQ